MQNKIFIQDYNMLYPTSVLEVQRIKDDYGKEFILYKKDGWLGFTSIDNILSMEKADKLFQIEKAKKDIEKLNEKLNILKKEFNQWVF